MKYPYKVKHNGVFYEVGEEVPTTSKAPEKIVAEPKIDTIEESKDEKKSDVFKKKR